jgi:dTDP-4-dehydrorhamnose 3,5-epimerase
MIFGESALAGVFMIELEEVEDERGNFARVLDAEEFLRRGLTVPTAQWSVSYNRKRGTLRGLHYQVAPHEEVKMVRCTRGAVYDVLLDIRPKSVTYRRWVSFELSQSNRRTLYIPTGIAHGYQTLTDDAELEYFISEPYDPTCVRGIRWDTAALGIQWPPVPERIISERDRSLPTAW